jgi:hypothetical protein
MISAAKEGRLAHDLPPQPTVKYRGNQNNLRFDILITSSVWLWKLNNCTYFVTVYCSALRKEKRDIHDINWAYGNFPVWWLISAWNELAFTLYSSWMNCLLSRKCQFYSPVVFLSDLTYSIEKSPVWTAVSGLDSQERFGFRITRRFTAVFKNADAILSLMIPSHIPTANIPYIFPNWFFMTPSISTKFQYINSLLLSFLLTTCFGPYGLSSGEIYN